MLELSKPIKNIYTSTFQQCIPSTSTTSSTLQFTVKQPANDIVNGDEEEDEEEEVSIIGL